MTQPKKLIEVALPLEAINSACAREKSIRHGHPSTLHLWWARRPLAAARAVIFAQMVDDPSGYVDELRGDPHKRHKAERVLKERMALWQNAKQQAHMAVQDDTPVTAPGIEPKLDDILAELEREDLFKLIIELVKWENTTNETVLQAARDAMMRSWQRTCAANATHPQAAQLFNPKQLPAFHDPFAGGGALPLEAQRLGLEAYASDLNPVAVMINKAMIEIPPKFANQPPVHPSEPRNAQLTMGTQTWRGAQGLAEDVRYYGQWMRDEAEKRIGHLYPKVEITPDMLGERPDLKPLLGKKLTVIAWLWARTVKSPNPAYAHVDVPLASTFMLSTKAGKEAYVQPILEKDTYRFVVKVGKPKDAEAAKRGTKSGSSGSSFLCLMSGVPMTFEYLRSEAKAKCMDAKLMAIVAEGDKGRIYLSPTLEMESIAKNAKPINMPETDLPAKALGFRIQEYGMTKWSDLFTSRQLVALTTFSDLVGEARERCLQDALVAFGPHPGPPPMGEGVDSLPHRGRAGVGASAEVGADVEAGAKAGDWRPTPVPPQLLQAARDLRQNMTQAEQLLWACLRGKQLAGFKFRRQHPIEKYVLDFYCPAAQLAIELDGSQHATPAGRAQDANRSAWLNEQGIRVIRFWNDEVLKNIDGVLQMILDALLPPPRPSPDGGGRQPPPPSGEGRGGGQTTHLRDGGTGALAYAEAVSVYLAFGVDRLADRSSTICGWDTGFTKIRNTFGRQALPMTWDYVEGNAFSDSTGNFSALLEWVEKFLLQVPRPIQGYSFQQNASSQSISQNKIISTDPPYYDNIGYADLSDFFYVWMRRSLQPIFPNLFATLAVPKTEELIATPYRHGNKEKAEAFFLNGMTQAMHQLAIQSHPAFPVSIYYAFKQSESDSTQGTTNTGWDTFLAAVIDAGFALTGTWPMRTELGNRMIGSGTNALASSIVLVCRKRPDTAPIATRRQFLNALKAELPAALRNLQAGNIAPVDLAQAAIGPGMAVFTRYAKVLDAQGQAVSVREALSIINQTLDEVLAEQEGDFDADSRWALAWFEQFGFGEGEFGVADVLARAKNTSVQGLVEAGVLASQGGKVHLFKPSQLSSDWNPKTDPRLTAWEVVHQLIRILESSGETATAAVVANLGAMAEVARELAYRLYTLCERKKRAQEALSYNALVQSWGEIINLVRNPTEAAGTQRSFDDMQDE